MVKKVKDIRGVIERVFATDEDLYLRRQHSDDKTLKGLVDYTMQIFDGELSDIDVYTYGDEYGFFAVNQKERYLRSFGIKKEHRDKKELFWDAVIWVLGDEFISFIWKDNTHAERFFNCYGNKIGEYENSLIYLFKKDTICQLQQL